MRVCVACGKDNPAEAKFCLECGEKLAARAPRQAERKVVTVLFADLVGFTSRSEAMDVEDVQGTLQPYHQLLRKELERYGGTVEKFIGDAVMALFGVPVAHEDDPERAVRAALSIQDAVAELREQDERLDLHVRIGVNTGEALVALGARPSEGEGMASGDVVNTAARLQSAAPVDGVLVGEVTYRATNRVIEYEEAEPVQAKGKTEPVRGWVAKQLRSRLGSDVQQAPSTPLVGRDDEVGLLWSALNRARREQSPQLVTLVGVPGIGKSRLVWELFQRVEAHPELITWRQGRSLPYGEGVAFWALGEIVKAQAGVLDSDAAEASAGKLQQAVSELISNERDAGWVEGHLRPLLGLETGQELSGDRQAEAFSAWRRFLEALAERGPAAVVFEDLHWADEALLDFIDYVVEWASGVPLLVLCTARPELLERRKGWGGGKVNTSVIALSPLSEADTARLVAALLEQAVLPADTQIALLERAEGNPLYAEEYVRMLIDRAVLVRDGAHWRVREGQDVPLPESVQGIIAARLDALSADEKALLQAAAVVGKVFWLGAVQTVAGVSRWQAEELLHRLERKEFVRRERQSSVEGESEYAFRHILVREVAYAQIPRLERATRHENAADWVESLPSNRSDRVELLAYHYLRAVDLYEAIGETPSRQLEVRARRALCDAGARAFSVSAYPSAVRYFEAAEKVADQSLADEFRVLAARAYVYSEDSLPEILANPETALPNLSVEARSDILVEVGLWLGNHGRADEGLAALERAVTLTEASPTSRGKVMAQAALASSYLFADRLREGLGLAERAANQMSGLDDSELRAVIEMTLAWGKQVTGDGEWIRHARASITWADRAMSFWSLVCYANISDCFLNGGMLADAFRVLDAGRQRAERLGARFWLDTFAVQSATRDFIVGDWAAAQRDLAPWEGDPPRGAGTAWDPIAFSLSALIALARGSARRAEEQCRRAIDAAAMLPGDPLAFMADAAFAMTLSETGSHQHARAVVSRHLPRLKSHLYSGGRDVALLALAAARSGYVPQDGQTVELCAEGVWAQASQAIFEGRLGLAVRLLEDAGALYYACYARVLRGQHLVLQGNAAHGAAELERSLAFWRRVGATAYIRECERLLARAQSA